MRAYKYVLQGFVCRLQFYCCHWAGGQSGGAGLRRIVSLVRYHAHSLAAPLRYVQSLGTSRYRHYAHCWP